MQTTDAGLVFQTSDDLAKSAARERKTLAASGIGRPLTVKGKILNFVVEGDLAFVAESGWQARCIDLRSGAALGLFRGHKGPVTSVALLDVSGLRPWRALFTGSWDKTIKVWDAESNALVATLEGHSDFVKSLTVVRHHSLRLISTSSDRTIRVWDLEPLADKRPPVCLQTLKTHTRPVEIVATFLREDDGDVEIWTADSMGVIKLWRLVAGTLEPVGDGEHHETSIGAMIASEEGLWTGSMDKTARFVGRASSSRITIPHPAYVTALLVVPPVASSGRSLVITGSEDEHIRIWDVDSLAEGSDQPLSVVEAHFGTVSAMHSWSEQDQASGSRSWRLVTGSLDGTLRRWSLQELLDPPKLAAPNPGPTMTEDEERELAELMSDDED